MKKKSIWVGIIAAFAALAGVAVAVGLFIKNAGKKLQEDLEFDDSIYFEDDDTDDLDRLEGVDQQSESQDEEEKEEE
jgi:hypothetical protein